MALYLPRLATDRVRYTIIAQAEGRPFAQYAKVGNAFVLSALDDTADKAGLRLGQSLSDARALRPDLITQEADPLADGTLLDDLAAWCERFTPIVVLDPPDGLFLDVTGCAHLFGDEAAMLRLLKKDLRRQGFNVTAAIAPTPGAAWAFARYGQTRLVAFSALEKALAPLPLAALRLTAEASALLRRLGLKTIGQIMNAPRQPFTARAGQHALLRLDQAFGRAAEALTPRRPPPPVFVLRRLLEPVQSLDAVLIVVADLCRDLSTKLEQRGLGVRLLRLCLFGVDGKARKLKLGLSRAERDPTAMFRLFRERLNTAPENLNAEFGFEALRLDALDIGPIIYHATDLAPASARDPNTERRCIDTLRARLGTTLIGTVSIKDAHPPGRANKWHSGSTPQPQPLRPPKDNVMRRPPFAFSKGGQPIDVIATVPDGPPVRFRWRRVIHQIVRAEGPERILPDWICNPGARACDYYRVEDQNGRRFWLYREGLYESADPQSPPRWFIQGFFA